uniref:Uncharacterized protein n=1 Tax=Acrobeloides nanus TaxID=290746 RepID=A0A914D9G3_9BILA
MMSSPPKSLNNSPIATNTGNKFMQNSPMSVQLQIRALERTIITYKSRVDELEGDLIDRDHAIQKLRSQVGGLIEKKDRLKEDNSRLPSLLEEVEQLNDKISDLNYQLDISRKKFNQLREERDEAIRKLERSELEAIGLAQTLDNCKEDYEHFVKKHESCYEERENLQQQLDFRYKECMKLENSLRKQAAELEQYQADTERNKQISKEDREREIEQLVSTYSETQQESARRIRKLEEEHQLMIEKNIEMVKSLESKNADLERENRTLNRKFSDFQDEINSERSRVHHELECLKNRVSDKEKYVCELETKRSELEHEISRHVDYITKLEAESAMAKEQSQKEIDRLIKNLEEMDNNLKRYKDEIVNAADHTRKLLTELKARDVTIKKLNDEISRLKEENECRNLELVEQIDKLKQKLAQEENEKVEPLLAQINSLKIERDIALENVKTVAQSKEVEYEEHQKIKAQQDELVSRLNIEKQELSEKIILLENQLQARDAEQFHSPRESDFYRSSNGMRSSYVSLKSFKSYQHPQRPPTGMSTQSMPVVQTIDFAAEDEPTIVMNGGLNKSVYDQQAPAPMEIEEMQASDADYQARIRELRERNRKNVPHMRSSYLTEVQGMPLDENISVTIKPKNSVEQFARALGDVPTEISRSRSSQSSSRSFKEKFVQFSDKLKKKGDENSGSSKKTPRKSIGQIFRQKN